MSFLSFSKLATSLGIILGLLSVRFPVSYSLGEVVFTALSPKIIRPYESYDMYISVEPMGDNGQTPVTFKVTVIEDSDRTRPDFNLKRRRLVRSLTDDQDLPINIEELPQLPVDIQLGRSMTEDDPPVSETEPPVVTDPPVNEEELPVDIELGTPMMESPPVQVTVLPVVTEEVVVVPGQTSSFKLTFSELPESNYNLTVVCLTPENTIVASDSAILHVERKDESAIIQTDKPIYKPGENVSFRVIVLNKQLKPSAKSPNDVLSKFITIKVLDSQSNVIQIWKKVELDATYAYVKKSLELSSEPNLGDWTIQVEVETQGNESTRVTGSYQQSFTVDQYVLPKFKVDIKPKPSFVTFEDSIFTLTIDAVYTYGKPVTGTCTVELAPDSPDWEYEYLSADPDDEEASVSPSPQLKRPQKVVKTLEIQGEGYLDFDLKSDLRIVSDDAYEYGNEFTIKASCSEGVSGKVQNTTGSIKLYRFPYKISAVDPPDTYKPGFPLTMTIKVASQDGTPISDNQPDALKIEHGFSYDSVGGVVTKPIPPTGLVPVTFTTPTNEYIYISIFDVTYKNLTQSISVPTRETSPTKTYMQLNVVMNSPLDSETTDDDHEDQNKNSSQSHGLIKAGDTVAINVRMNKAFGNLHYIVVSRGQIILKERASFPTKNKEQIITLKVPTITSNVRQVTLIVYALIGPKKELIADQIPLDVMAGMQNQLKITVGSQTELTTGPGSNINVACEGTPQSLIAVRAVDQSVLLLAEDKDVTKDSLKVIQDSFDEGIGNHRLYGGSEAFQTFDKTGIHVLTNGLMRKQYEYRRRFGGLKLASFNAAPMMRMAKASRQGEMVEQANVAMDDEVAGSEGGGFFSGSVQVRTSFPETWIFKEVEALDDGKVELNEVVPDTITSWMISGFQINPDEGIGLSDGPSKLTVFRPFFITLNVPYSIVQGEVVSLQVLVHNYLPEATKAKVILDNSRQEMEILEFPNTFDTEISKEIEIQGSSVSTVSFLVSSRKIGKITLSVKGLVETAGDAVSQPLIVRPPGSKHVRNQVVFLSLVENGAITKEIEAIFPKTRVTGGDSVKVSVLGDVLGGTMHNLESLIQLPTGCGEQNMLAFVPDIVVLDYLNSLDDLNSDVQKKALRYLQIGYQRELTYRRSDGSFSAFGESDPAGSTWLTAFVVKSFIAAKKYIYINEVIIQSALEFLTEQQNVNGSFVEEGKILQMGMQGVVSVNKYALTAYCLTAFIEAQASGVSDKFQTGIDKGIDFLLDSFDKGVYAFKNLYTVNVVTYLLHLVEHPRQNELFEVMQNHAKLVGNDDLKYWKISPEKILRDESTDEPLTRQFYWNPTEPQFRPASIEITAYALLTQLIRDKRNETQEGASKDSIAIARWLMSQRNENGGFLSTQDTVVGITALSLFAQAIKIPKNTYSVEITASWTDEVGSEEGSHDFLIGPDSTTVLQEYILRNGVQKVSVTAKGTGTALAQVTWTYYTLLTPNVSEFALAVTVEGMDSNRRLEMNICTTYLRNSTSSNMAILEVNTPTGYSFEPEELIEVQKSNSLIKRHDLEDKDTKLNIYFSSLRPNRQICLTLTLHREYMVAKHAKASVVIFDYYDTTKRAQTFYDAPKIDPCSICKTDATCRLNNCV